MTVPQHRLGDYFSSRRERGTPGLPTLSVTLDRGLIFRDELERRTDTTLSPEEHLRVYPGDIAYNMMRMWQGASGLANSDAIVSPAYVVLAPKKTIDPKFAADLFKLPEMIHRFWAYSHGLTEDRLRLYPDDFARIPCHVPPLPEQKKIAEILSTWDAAIETTGKLLANAEAQKRALMQQLLTGKRRLKGFEGREWKLTHLSALAEILMGSSPPSAAYNQTEDGMPLIQGNADIKNGVTSPRFYTSVITQRCEPDDILLSIRAPVGAIAKSLHSACVGRGIAVLRSKLSSDQGWVYQTLLLFEPQWAKISQGSTFEAVTGKEIRAIAMYMPTDQLERKAISDVLAAQDNLISCLKAQSAGLQSEKRALMQQLLTGKKRVSIKSEDYR